MFSDDQVAQALRESMAQGFTLDQSLLGAANKFGVSQDQLARVQQGFAPAPAPSTLPFDPLDDIYSDLTTPTGPALPSNVAPLNPLQEINAGLPQSTTDSLTSAGLVETVPTLAELTTTPTAATAPAATPATTTSVTPQNLVTGLLGANPDLFKGTQFRGDESFSGVPTTESGGFTVRPTEEIAYTPYEEQAYGTGNVGGYAASKTFTKDNGLKQDLDLQYDAAGKITGITVKDYTGGDSGVEYVLDPATGKVTGTSKFDYSESWKGAVAPLASMAAIAFAPGLANYLTGLGSAAGLGAGAASSLGAAGSAGTFAGIQGALAGQEGGDLLRTIGQAAVSAGLSSGAGKALVGKAADAVGSAATSILPEALPDSAYNAIGNAATGATKGIIQQGVGSLLTGKPLDVTGALTSGAVSGGVQSLIGDSGLAKGLTPTAQQAISNAVAGALLGGDVSLNDVLKLAEAVSRSQRGTAPSGSTSMLPDVSVTPYDSNPLGATDTAASTELAEVPGLADKVLVTGNRHDDVGGLGFDLGALGALPTNDVPAADLSEIINTVLGTNIPTTPAALPQVTVEGKNLGTDDVAAAPAPAPSPAIAGVTAPAPAPDQKVVVKDTPEPPDDVPPEVPPAPPTVVVDPGTPVAPDQKVVVKDTPEPPDDVPPEVPPAPPTVVVDPGTPVAPDQTVVVTGTPVPPDTVVTPKPPVTPPVTPKPPTTPRTPTPAPRPAAAPIPVPVSIASQLGPFQSVFYQQMMEAERAQALAEELVQAQQTAESDALLNAVMAETQRGDYTPGSIEELLEYLERTA